MALSDSLLRLSVRTAGLLPLPFARFIGACLARFAWAVQDRSSKVTLRNLELCFPQWTEVERKHFAKQSLIETGKLAAEVSGIWCKSPEALRKYLKAVHNEPVLQQAVTDGSGVALLAPHIGNWELIGQFTADYGQMTTMYLPPKKKAFEDIVIAAREKAGSKLVPANHRGVAALLKALKKGEIIGVLPDQNPLKGNGEFSRFYGVPAYTLTLIHGLLQRTDTKVLFTVMKRVQGGFEWHFINPPQAIYSDDLDEHMLALNKGVEECIALCPEQYQWEYKRFRRQPEGAPKVYRSC